MPRLGHGRCLIPYPFRPRTNIDPVTEFAKSCRSQLREPSNTRRRRGRVRERLQVDSSMKFRWEIATSFMDSRQAARLSSSRSLATNALFCR